MNDWNITYSNAGLSRYLFKSTIGRLQFPELAVDGVISHWNIPFSETNISHIHGKYNILSTNISSSSPSLINTGKLLIIQDKKKNLHRDLYFSFSSFLFLCSTHGVFTRPTLQNTWSLENFCQIFLPWHKG